MGICPGFGQKDMGWVRIERTAFRLRICDIGQVLFFSLTLSRLSYHPWVKVKWVEIDYQSPLEHFVTRLD